MQNLHAVKRTVDKNEGVTGTYIKTHQTLDYTAQRVKTFAQIGRVRVQVITD